MAAAGYTPAEIDDMTMFDVTELFKYWREFPPVHEILRAVYKIEPKKEAERPKAMTAEDIALIKAACPGGFMRG